MKFTFPKSKLAFANLTILLIILGGIMWIESGPEPWLDSEKVFMARLHNSLYELDRAKYTWAKEKSKPEDAIPTFEDLAPYLGKWKDTIEKLKSLGVEYRLTSSETNQSDAATLTQGIRFHAGICCFYRAGTTLCLQTGWKSPPPTTSPITLRIRLIWLHGGFFLRAALFILAVANALIFLVRKLTKSAKPPESRDTPSAAISANLSTPPEIKARDLYVLIFG